MSNGWIGVDLDGTLAHYNQWISIDHIGEPIPAMVDRVKKWISMGIEVRIFTARVGEQPGRDIVNTKLNIYNWCIQHIGVAIPVTCQKDFGMIQLWDDRCVQVETNTGKVLGVDPNE